MAHPVSLADRYYVNFARSKSTAELSLLSHRTIINTQPGKLSLQPFHLQLRTSRTRFHMVVYKSTPDNPGFTYQT